MRFASRTGVVLLAMTLTTNTSGLDAVAPAPDTSFAIREIDGVQRIELSSGERVLLASPAEGLWSIATAWEDNWPANWQHAAPRKVETSGPWTVVSGELESAAGVWKLRDAYLPQDRFVKCVRRFTWKGEQAAEHCTLSVRWQTPYPGAQVYLPSIIHYGNPSGAKSGRVAVYIGAPGEEALFEEHRYPAPYACFEWQDDEAFYGAALHTCPSRAPYGNHADQWWSLGAIARQDTSELTMLSGPTAANGKRGVVKALQRGFMEYPDAYLNVPPNAVIEKTFYLAVYPVGAEGSGFRRPLHNAIDICAPLSCEGLPTFREILDAKLRFARSRWHETEKAAGFRMYPHSNHIVMGWCGRAAVPGYALQVLSLSAGKPDDDMLVRRSLDFLTTAPFNEHGFMLCYDTDTDVWSGQDPVSQGQGMEAFARAILTARKNQRFDTTKWEVFLRKACDIHATRILGDDWHPKSTNEGFLVSPLCKAYQFFGVEQYRAAAIKAAEHYADRHVNMREPYWGGTLDARCEDKEGAWAAFQAFLSVYELTHEQKYLDWATHACDVTLSYTQLWDIDLPPGRLRDHNFKTRGWTVVSAQNQHLDVFGVMYTPEIYRMGDYLNRDELKKLAILMFRTCGQLIDPFGSQGEQIQHTNFAQHGDMSNVYTMRGGYSEGWTVFWITTHFLSAAAQFEEMGVEIWE